MVGSERPDPWKVPSTLVGGFLGCPAMATRRILNVGSSFRRYGQLPVSLVIVRPCENGSIDCVCLCC